MVIEKNHIEAVAQAMRDGKTELNYKGVLQFFMEYSEEEDTQVVREATHYDEEEQLRKTTYDIREVSVFVITRSKDEEDMLLGVFDGHEMAILERELESGVWGCCELFQNAMKDHRPYLISPVQVCFSSYTENSLSLLL